MKITFLGTNGWYDTESGNTVCTLVETSKYYLVFDAGDGLYKLDKFIRDKKPIYLFLSHFHIDHVSGLHILPKFKFTNPIKIFMEKGRKKDFTRLVNKPYMAPINNRLMKQKITVTELKYGLNKIPFPVYIGKIDHMWSAIGFRVELDNKIIAYCMDTAICENCEILGRNADVLIHECSILIKQSARSWGHAYPKEVAELAKRAGVKKLILSHFSADKYKTRAMRLNIIKSINKIFKNVVIAIDGKTVKI
jgi:ribonuclease Z